MSGTLSCRYHNHRQCPGDGSKPTVTHTNHCARVGRVPSKPTVQSNLRENQGPNGQAPRQGTLSAGPRRMLGRQPRRVGAREAPPAALRGPACPAAPAWSPAGRARAETGDGTTEGPRAGGTCGSMSPTA